MDRILRTARRARAQSAVAALTRSIGVSLMWATAAGLLFIVAARMTSLPIPWWLLIAAPLAAAILFATITTLLHRRTLLDAAASVDETFHLKDRLSTAVAFSSMNGPAPTNDPFVSIALADADAAASGIDARKADPVRFGPAWKSWPVILAVAVATGLFMPELDLLGRGARAERIAQTTAARQDLAARIDSAIELAQPPAPPESPNAPPARPEQLQVLEDLQRELAEGSRPPEQALQDAAHAIEQLASDAQQQAERGLREQQAMRDALARAASPQPAVGATESPLARAIRTGDLAAAQEAARELMGLDKAGEQERAAQAQEFERLARDLEQLDARERAASPPQPDADPAAPQPQATPEPTPAERDLRNLGVPPEQARRLAQETDPEAIQRELEQSGMEPQAAERIAGRTADEAAQHEADERAKEQTRDLSRALREFAEKLKQQPPPRSDSDRDPASPQDQPKPDQPRPEGGQSPKADQKPDEQQRQEQPAEPRQGAQPREGKGTRQDQPTDKPEGDKSGSQPRETPSSPSSQPGEQGQPKPSDPAQPKASEQDQPKSGKTQPGEPKSGQQGQPKPGEQGQPTPSEQGGQPRPSGQEQGAAEKPAPSGQPKPGDQAKPGAKPSQQEQQQGTPKDGQAQEPGPTGEKRPGADKGQDPLGAKPGEPKGGEPRPGEKPGAEGEAPPDGAPPENLKQAAEQLARQFEKMNEPGKSAGEKQKQARELSEMARDMMEKMTPQQQDQMRRWGEQMAKEMRPPDRRGGGDGDQPGGDGPGMGDPTPPRTGEPAPYPPSRTDIVDARPKGDEALKPGEGERVVGEWFGDGKPGEGVASREQVAQSLREAARSAERAVEDRTIPGRYDKLLRRYFDRLPRRVLDEPAQKTAPDAP